MSYWMEEQKDFCFSCNELAPLWQEAEDRGVPFLYSEEAQPTWPELSARRAV